MWDDRVGTVEGGIRYSDAADGAVMVYAAPTEQGFAMEIFGEPTRKVVEIEGVQLIQVMDTDSAAQKSDLLEF